MIHFYFYYYSEADLSFFFFFQAEDGIRDADVTGVQTCALPILQRTRIEFRVEEQLVDDLDRPRGRPCVRVVRVGLAQERDDIEIALPALVQEDPGDARDHTLLEDRDAILPDHVHRLVRRADAVDF